MGHHCHWPGCSKAVPPKMWGCLVHWRKLPLRLRNEIWAAYKPGQEISKTPSAEYIAVAKRVQEWIANHNTLGPRQATPPILITNRIGPSLVSVKRDWEE